MKKYFFYLAALAMMNMPTAMLAQDDEEGDIETPFTPTIETGYYRIVNNGYGDVLNVDSKYGLSLNATETSARTMPGSVFYYDTDGMYNFADDMKQFEDEDGNLNITVTQLMQLMATSAWKSGSFTTYYGRAMAVVRAGDSGKVTVTAKGGETAMVTIKIK